MFLVFGNPISHSKSPLMHNYFLKKAKINKCYTRYRLEDGSKIIEKFKELKLDGANVTVPHKEWAYKLADEVRGIAKKIKAVNTLVKEGDKVIGYNTDAPGFLESIKEFDYKKPLIIGAGGSAKAIAAVLRDAAILNRSKERLKNFSNRSFTWNEINEFDFDIIINTTSAGLENALPAPKEILEKLFKNAKYAVDIVYSNTPFLKLAREYNLITKDGLDMLIYQGIFAMELFLNRKLSEKEKSYYFEILKK